MEHDITPADRALLDAIARLPDDGLTGDLAARFRTRMDAERRHRRLSRWVPLMVAAVLLLAIAFGWKLDHQRQDTRSTSLERALVAALANRSVVIRLQAVNGIPDPARTNPAVLQALANALHHDPNANVRMAAATALGKLAAASSLRDIVASALRNESSPFVQTALLDLVTHLTSRDRNAALDLLLNRNDIDPIVRATASAQRRL